MRPFLYQRMPIGLNQNRARASHQKTIDIYTIKESGIEFRTLTEHRVAHGLLAVSLGFSRPEHPCFLS